MNRLTGSFFVLPSLLLTCLTASYGAGTISQPGIDSGATSSQFGFSIGVSGRSLLIGAPFNDLAGSPDLGDMFTFDTTSLTYTGDFYSAVGSAGKHGAAVSGGSNDFLIGAPGASSSAGRVQYWRSAGPVTIANPAPAANDEFGRAVAVGKKQMIIGAPGDAGGPGAALSGSAFYVSKRDLIPVRLPLPNYATGDQAGCAVAVSNKFIAVGSRGAASGSSANSGAVHIYDAKTHAFRITLSITDALASPRFGESVAFGGKYLFIGAPAQNYLNPVVPGSAIAAGAVYQFDLKTMSLVHTFYAPTPQADAGFGTSFSADKKRLLVGSPSYDAIGAADAGAADLYDIRTGAYITSPLTGAPAANEKFGQAVLLFKPNQMAIGAPAPDSPSNDGHVYVRAITP